MNISFFWCFSVSHPYFILSGFKVWLLQSLLKIKVAWLFLWTLFWAPRCFLVKSNTNFSIQESQPPASKWPQFQTLWEPYLRKDRFWHRHPFPTHDVALKGRTTSSMALRADNKNPEVPEVVRFGRFKKLELLQLFYQTLVGWLGILILEWTVICICICIPTLIHSYYDYKIPIPSKGCGGILYLREKQQLNTARWTDELITTKSQNCWWLRNYLRGSRILWFLRRGFISALNPKSKKPIKTKQISWPSGWPMGHKDSLPIVLLLVLYIFIWFWDNPPISPLVSFRVRYGAPSEGKWSFH